MPGVILRFFFGTKLLNCCAFDLLKSSIYINIHIYILYIYKYFPRWWFHFCNFFNPYLNLRKVFRWVGSTTNQFLACNGSGFVAYETNPQAFVQPVARWGLLPGPASQEDLDGRPSNAKTIHPGKLTAGI